MEWILVLFIYAGPFTKGDSVTLAEIPGWGSKAACEAAGEQTKPLTSGSSKALRFVCIPRQKGA